MVSVKYNLVTGKKCFKILLFSVFFPVPLVFCLCERRTYETYELIIQVLKMTVTNLKSDFKPTYWMSDYENALVKAIKLGVNSILNSFSFVTPLFNLH